jgi:hypothetical protein
MFSCLLRGFQACTVCPFIKSSFADDKDEYGAMGKTVSMSSKFLHHMMHMFFKRSIKIHIKTAPTCFGVITIIRERTI